nr:intercompartmental signaling factor BofC [Metabacillus kandeliae]
MKRLKSILVIAVCFPILFFTFQLFGKNLSEAKTGEPLKVNVLLERVYLDGETSEEKKTETVWSMEDFWAEYEGWKLLEEGPSRMIFRKKVDDISPLMKANGYFGITDNGILTIFLGKPDHPSKVIQSFFQIDVGKLETKNVQELDKGIRVENRKNYVKVIESFRRYSTVPEKK